LILVCLQSQLSKFVIATIKQLLLLGLVPLMKYIPFFWFCHVCRYLSQNQKVLWAIIRSTLFPILHNPIPYYQVRKYHTHNIKNKETEAINNNIVTFQ
jgi:hypothetical protein